MTGRMNHLGGHELPNLLVGVYYAQPVDRYTVKTFEVVPA